MEDLQKQIFEEVKKYEGGEEIIDEIKERFNGNLGAFLQFIAEQRTKLAAIAEKAQLNDNPTSSPGGGNKQPNNTDPVDQLGEQYQAAILKQRQELSELSVAAMQEGADKERAQIRLEYEKNDSNMRMRSVRCSRLSRSCGHREPMSILEQRNR